MRKVKYAGIQMRCVKNAAENIKTADRLVREAASKGAQIILLPELFENRYFCQERNYDSYLLAKPVEENDAVIHFRKLAKELKVVLPISFYERDVNVFYNSVAVIDADGSVLGIYRKTHIPDDHFYQEKFYLTPVSRYGIPDMPESVWESAGISGFRNVPEEWRYRGRSFCCIPLQSEVSLFWNATVCPIGEDACRDMLPAILSR